MERRIESLEHPRDLPRKSPIPLIVFLGYIVLLGLIWIDEAVDLPHALLGAPPTPISWRAALLHSAMVTGVSLLVGLLLWKLVKGRREAHVALADMARRLRILAEHTYDWAFWQDPDGRFLYASPSCRRITGHPPEDFAQDADLLMRVIHPEDRAAFDRHRREVHRSRSPGETRFRIVRPDGAARWIGHVCQPIFDESGAFLGIRGTNRDITERVEAEEALRSSEAHLRRAQEVAVLGSWDLDLETGELFWSDEVCRLFGVPVGSALDYERFLSSVHPDDRGNVDRSWRAALGGAPYDIEHRITVGDEVKWVREKAEVEFGTDGKARRGIGIVQDITPRKRAEQEADRLEDELAHVTRVATLGEFSAALAHELNQPLAAMLCNAQAALRFLDAPEPDLTELREILDDIVADDQRARDVILKLRELTRKPSEGRAHEPLEVNPLVEGVLRIVHGDLVMREVSLETGLAADVRPVAANAIQLQQALLNLILNALEAMEGCPRRRLRVETRNADDGRVEISVLDTGPGIASTAAEGLFQPFVTTKEQGMGMGLAISRAIVEAHAGRLTAGSAPDGGARFVIDLPAAGGAG